VDKIDAFLDLAFGKAAKGVSQVLCPCSKCANRKRQNKENMSKHLLKNGFTLDYTRWVHHGEAHRMREEMVRPHIKDYDADARVDVTEPPNYTKLSRKIIQLKDNLTNLSPYNPVVREISTDFKPFHITAKIVLSLTVTIISYIKVRGIKYIGV
jgi:hypothetical protein